jgi:hypothetical protein
VSCYHHNRMMVVFFASLERAKHPEGYAWHTWFPAVAPLVFGIPDEGFAVPLPKEVILKTHHHVHTMVWKRYRLPTQQEKDLREKSHMPAAAGSQIDVTNGYVLVGSIYQPLVELEEDITESFYTTKNHILK